LSTYDINNDDFVQWGEFNVGNLGLKKKLPYAKPSSSFLIKTMIGRFSKK
jgi:hypothetical protein